MLLILAISLLAAEPAETSPPEHVQKYLERCKEAKVDALPIPLPPAKGDIGVFEPAKVSDQRRGKSLDLLEVVDKDNAILRAWYVNGGELTFVDLWFQGIDTSSLASGSPAKLPQVFHVTGSKLIDTTCGKRSFVLLEPIDFAPFRKAAGK